jgi:mannosyl-3-phosphoglycerate phosphatase
MFSLVIFTDIDGTFVDEKYSYNGALPALELIKVGKIPLIFCSSKTRAEIEVYRNELGIEDPFISENGGAIFVPRGYFGRRVGEKLLDGYEIIELGTSYKKLRKILEEAEKASGCRITGFGDMTTEEISRDSGLDLETAKLAKMRDYDEAFRIEGSGMQIEKALGLIKAKNLNYVKGGRYYHILGDNDKGKAIRILTEIYRSENPGARTIGLGDSYNDIPMLENVDIPVVIKRPDGTHVEFADALKSELVGPEGWGEVVLGLISKPI